LYFYLSIKTFRSCCSVPLPRIAGHALRCKSWRLLAPCPHLQPKISNQILPSHRLWLLSFRERYLKYREVSRPRLFELGKRTFSSGESQSLQGRNCTFIGVLYSCIIDLDRYLKSWNSSDRNLDGSFAYNVQQSSFYNTFRFSKDDFSPALCCFCSSGLLFHPPWLFALAGGKSHGARTRLGRS